MNERGNSKGYMVQSWVSRKKEDWRKYGAKLYEDQENESSVKNRGFFVGGWWHEFACIALEIVEYRDKNTCWKL